MKFSSIPSPFFNILFGAPSGIEYYIQLVIKQAVNQICFKRRQPITLSICHFDIETGAIGQINRPLGRKRKNFRKRAIVKNTAQNDQSMQDQAEAYRIYKSLVEKVMSDPEQLPSLPNVTLKIRSALGNPNITHKALGAICAQDPSFATLLLSVASAAIYRQARPPVTLSEVVAVLGTGKVDNLSMSHAIKSLFLLSQPKLKALYKPIWERLMLKASIAAFLSQRVRREIPEEVLLAALLSEIGTLAMLSAFKDGENIPEKGVFFKLCREYSKGFGAVLLTKWRVETRFINVMKSCGHWKTCHVGNLDMLDLVNLSLYATIKIITPNNSLPALTRLPCYQKLPYPYNSLDENGSLMIIGQHIDEIEELKRSLGS